MTAAALPRPHVARVEWLDGARGAALAAMAVYHFVWDLAAFGYLDPATTTSEGMHEASHLIASAFLAIVGYSLGLAHPQGLRAGPFARRLATVAGAAALVTFASFYFAPGEAITMGVLHCIVLSSLVAVAFLRAPPFAILAGAALAFALPLAVSGPAFDAPALAWTGLGTTPPATLDWRPLLPWCGVTLLGLAAARLLPPRPAPSVYVHGVRPPAAPSSRVSHGLGTLGRHSLAFYLLHQVFLYGGVALAAHALPPDASLRAVRRTCIAACAKSGGPQDACVSGCKCCAREAARRGLLAAMNRTAL
ncbi:MAG: DUF1624 domain-containing protein, partial [Hyphomicrobiales bacterium]|nr:DUF1624 domain-containing protein [Hyphomicrobiales bacterium]